MPSASAVPSQRAGGGLIRSKTVRRKVRRAQKVHTPSATEPPFRRDLHGPARTLRGGSNLTVSKSRREHSANCHGLPAISEAPGPVDCREGRSGQSSRERQPSSSANAAARAPKAYW